MSFVRLWRFGSAVRIIGTLTITLGAATGPARCDITARNVDHDRAAFVRCGNAMEVMSGSRGALAGAAYACGRSFNHYSHRFERAHRHDEVCLTALYAASSAYRYGFVLAKFPSKSAAPQARSIAASLLTYVIRHCSDEPNIMLAAKAVKRAARSSLR